MTLSLEAQKRQKNEGQRDITTQEGQKYWQKDRKTEGRQNINKEGIAEGGGGGVDGAPA